MPDLSDILDRFTPSAISQIFNLAVELKEQGRDLADFSTGEPDFDTPDHIKAAGKAAIDAGQTKYTAVDGTSALRKSIQRKFARDNGLDYPLDQIVVSAGAKPLLYNTLQALVNPGDEVIIPTPCWPSHPGGVLLAGATPVFLPAPLEQGFKVTPAQLDRAITARTKVLILCSPSNPTGAGYSAAELTALGEVLLRHPQVWILSDDLYEKIVFDDFQFTTLAQVEPRLLERIVTVNGVSKSYAMTGWRIGYAGGPKPVIAGIKKIFSQACGNPCSISQAAAIEALEGPQDFLSNWAASYQSRRDLALAGLAQAPGLKCARPEGAFYLYPWCGGVLGKTTPGGTTLESSADFARYLLEDHGVVVVPGAAFECDPYFRMSIATSEAEIEKGVGRILEACTALS